MFSDHQSSASSSCDSLNVKCSSSSLMSSSAYSGSTIDAAAGWSSRPDQNYVPPGFGTGILQHQQFLANVNSRLRSLYAITHPSVVCLSSVCLSVICLSVVCNVRAPYSGGSNFRQYFYGIRYLGHPLTSVENFTEIVPGEPLCRGS